MTGKIWNKGGVKTKKQQIVTYAENYQLEVESDLLSELGFLPRFWGAVVDTLEV